MAHEDYMDSSEDDDSSQGKRKIDPPWFEWKLNIGTLITILSMVVIVAISHGAATNRLEALEKNNQAQVIANERQANTNDRLVEELHSLGKTMIRLQTQLEDRQYQIDQRQDRQDVRDRQRK